MATTQRTGPTRRDPSAGRPRHLVNALLITAVVVLGAGMLRLTGRVTSLELQLDSFEAAANSPGSARSAEPVAQPAPPQTDKPAEQDDPLSGASLERQAAGNGGGVAMRQPGPGGNGGPGAARGSGGQRLDDEQFEQVREEVLELLDDYIDDAGLDGETAQALEDELTSAFSLRGETTAKVKSGEMSESEAHSYLRSERQRSTRAIRKVLARPFQELQSEQ